MSAGRKRVRSDANVNMSPEWTGGRWRATASIDREFIPFYQSQGKVIRTPPLLPILIGYRQSVRGTRDTPTYETPRRSPAQALALA